MSLGVKVISLYDWIWYGYGCDGVQVFDRLIFTCLPVERSVRLLFSVENKETKGLEVDGYNVNSGHNYNDSLHKSSYVEGHFTT